MPRIQLENSKGKKLELMYWLCHGTLTALDDCTYKSIPKAKLKGFKIVNGENLRSEGHLITLFNKFGLEEKINVKNKESHK